MSLIMDMAKFALAQIPRTTCVRIRQTAPGVVVEGESLEGVYERTTHTDIHVQRAEGRILELLPVGDRSTETIVLYGPTDSCRVAEPATENTQATEADTFEVFGKTFKVTRVDLWDDSGNYQRALAQKIEL